MFREPDNEALSGMRVLDLSQGIAGPHASMLLALNGADVVKVEPLGGDWGRVLGKSTDQETASYLSFNRGKRSLAIDLRSASGQLAMSRLIPTCDIVIESFRPGVAAKLDVGYEQICRVSPKVIYASVSGFGQRGAMAQRPAVDGVIQAYSGMMQMNRTSDGQPHQIGMVIVDVTTGLYAHQAILAAAMRRLRFDVGAQLDINMAQCAAALQTSKIVEFHQSKGQPQALYAPAGIFETQEGRLYVSGMRQEHFVALCNVLGVPSLSQDPRWPTAELRVRFRSAIHQALQRRFMERPAQAWLPELHAAGILAERVRSYGDWIDAELERDPDAYAWMASATGPVPIPRVPGFDRSLSALPPPRIGQHSCEILSSLGFDSAWIDEAARANRVGLERRSG